MLKLCRVTEVNVFFLVLAYVFNFDLFKFSAANLEKGLLSMKENINKCYNELQVHAKFNLPDKYYMSYYRYLTNFAP